MNLLEVRNLTTLIDNPAGEVRAVDGISFEIAPGEIFALVGESGCGKSMSALSILRLLPEVAEIAAGRIFAGGVDLLALPERAMRDIRGRKLAIIFQEPATSLNPVLTVGRQIAEVLERHTALKGAAVRQRVLELLAAVHIPEPERRIDSYPFQLSGGQKQRIMIACALAAEPEILIADEPTTALDVTIQAEILVLLRELQKKTGMAILLITHDLGIVAQLADRVGVMYGGKLLEVADCETFFRAPQHAYSRKLFAALPTRAKRGTRLGTDGEPTANIVVQSTSAQTLLEVHGLKVHYPIRKGVFRRPAGYVKAVDGVDLTLAAGRTLALVGESGCGKTTVGKALLQLLPVTVGSVRFDGDEMTQLSGERLRLRRRDIQIVFQDPYASLNPRMRIAEVLEEGMTALGVGVTTEARQRHIDELLMQVGLDPAMRNRYPHEFSGGQRQRVAIARALAVNPKLIVCDEPTSALDVSVQAQILNLLQDLQARLGLAYLFITHNMALVEYFAHDVAVMYQGKIVESGTVDAILDHPQHGYTKKLLAAVPRLDVTMFDSY